ncbi:hypothetical protein TVAG_070280 [Trichomonas vaginalis G3]|uniref:Uncharacterized protein n=1 Tax=Trichomonas vaginalis (strain ATCC PRA-98 / G3) TaxID=412133 RepID=A2D7T2_TRIV3|nr:Rrp15p family [Trichomonas vaginalis G3]EAY23365.1 hypothetical protein TVAG_070280 [Trichomonas vaginalis G3]KAI5493780.1 Rrp15p family [Trichomonas vaginalis G3]|eukprot:XP_001584351.1 hypothetical protein [Trichomonas vaginalis G3]
MSSSDEEEQITEEELTSSDEEEPTDRSFGENYAALLNEVIPDGKCPILFLSKIPAKIASEREKQLKATREAERYQQGRKAMLDQFHTGYESYNDDDEYKLRKKATKGVIELFKSVHQAQNKKPITDTPPEKDDTPNDADEYLNILSMAAAKPAAK